MSSAQQLTQRYLDANGVRAQMGPANNSLLQNLPVLRGPNVEFEIYVEIKDEDKAKQLLKERTTPEDTTN